MAADGTNTEDIMGRDLSSLVTSIDALKSILSQTKTSIEQKLGGATPDASGLKDILEQVIKGFSDAAGEQEQFVKKVIQSLKGVDLARVQKQADSKLNKPRMKEEIRFNRKLEKIQEKIQRKGRENWIDTTEALVRDTAKRLGKSWEHTLEYLEKMDDKGIQKLQAEFDALDPEKVKYILENTEDLVSGLSQARNENEELNKAMQEYYSALSNAKYQIYDINRIFQNFEGFLGLETTKTLFADVYETERKFTQEMRQIAFETAGVTKESFGLQRAYENIGATVKATGFDRTKFQESYRKALKSGIKDLKQAVALTSTQLNTEKQLGLEAGSLQENFQQMVQSGRMSNNQIADMGRGMRQVARTTGLTGEALKGVIDSSMQFVDQMRKAATLSSTASKNIIELGANAKKLGVEEEMNKLRTGLSSSTSLLTEAAGETQTLIFLAASRVGKIEEALNGTLLRSKEGVKDFAQGMKSILQGFGVDSLEAIDQMGDEAKRVLNLQLKATVGMELGAFRSIIESYEQAGQSLGERLDSINKKMTSNLTISEKNALVEEQRALKSAKQLEVLTVLDEAAKGAKNMDQALAKFGERRKEFEGDLKTLGIDFQNDADVIRGSLEGAVKDINAGLKKSGKSELKIDSSAIEKAVKDPAAFRELTSKIVEGEKELATAQKAQLDPLTQTNQTLTEINDSIRNLSQSVISNLLTGVVGQFIMLAGVVAGLGSFLTGTIANSFFELNRMIDKVFFGVSEYGGKTNTLLKNIEIILGGRPAEDKQKTPAPTTTPQPPTTTNPTGNAASTTEPPKPAKKGMLGGIGDMFSGTEGKDLAKAAAAILALSVGIVALGSAIVFLADKVMASFDLDVNKVMQTAQLVGAIAMAGGAIATAGVVAFEAMNSQAAQDFLGKVNASNIKQFLMFSGVLLILGPAVVGLGASIVAITNMILSKLNVDINRVLEVAGVVTALGAAATGMIFAVMEFANFIDQNKERFDNLVTNARKYLYYMAVGGAALFGLSLGIVTLAALIVKSSQLILSVFGLDAATADKVAENIAHLFGAVAVISAAVLATTAALIGLGVLTTFLSEPIAGSTAIPLMLAGAGALLALSLVMPLFAAAVISFANAGNSFYTGDEAIKAAENVGKLLLAAGAIALGVLGATAGLIGLGLLVYGGAGGFAWPALLGLMALGAVVLLALTPAITLLAGAVIQIANASMGAMGTDPEYAAQVAENFASIMISAGKIALGVLAASAALVGLGLLIGNYPVFAAAILGGAVALYFLIDPITKLASSIIELTNQVLGQIVSPDEAEKAGKAVSSIFSAAGTIAYEITKSMVNLGALGLLSIGTIGFIPGLMAVGAFALEEMTAPVVHYVQTVMSIANQVKNVVRGEDPEKIAKEIKSVFEMAASVSNLISSRDGGLLSISKYGDWWNYLSFGFLGQTIGQRIDSAVYTLSTMVDPVVKYIQQIKEFSDQVRSKLGSSDKDAIESAKSIIGVLNAAGDVTTQIMKAKDALTTLQSGDWTSWLTFGMSSVPSRMESGALLIPDLGRPIGLYLQAIVQFTNNVKRYIGGKTPEYMSSLSQGLVTIMKSAGEITEQIMKTKDTLLKISNSDWGTYLNLTGTISQKMEDGRKAFVNIGSVVPNYLNSVLSVANEVKSKIKYRPEEIAARAYDFVVIFDSMNKISSKINEIRPMMLKIAAENKAGGKNKTFVQAVDMAKINLMLIRGSLINYMTSSMQFAQDIVAIVPVGESRRILSQTEDISKIVSITAKMITQMREEILPHLTKNTKTLSTKELADAQTKISNFFPTLITLMNGIRTQVKQTAGNLSDFEDSISHIARINQVVKSFGEIMQVLSSDAFSQTNLKKVNDALLVLGGYSQQVGTFQKSWVDVTGLIDTLSSFISNKLLVRVKGMANVDELKETANKLQLTSLALSQLLNAISELPPIFTRLQYLKNDTVETNFTQLDETLGKTSKFIRDKLITRVNEFPEKGKLNNTKYMLEDLAQVLRSTLNAVIALNAIFIEMKKNPDNAWEETDPTKIAQQRNNLKTRFESISSLITDGIVTPVLKTFGKDAIRLSQASSIIENLATVASKVPDLFKNLGTAMKMLTSPLNVEGFDKIKETREFSQFFEEQSPIFEAYFPQIVNFIDDIILKNLSGFAGKYNMGEIVASAQGFSNVVDATTRIIIGLRSVFDLMGKEVSKGDLDVSAPIGFILKNKGTFAKSFEQIMQFIQNDVVNVYKKFTIPDKDIELVTQNLMSISSLFEELPKFFNAVGMLNPTQARPDAAGKLVPYFTTLREVEKGLQEAFINTEKTAAPGIGVLEKKENMLAKVITFINEQVLPPLKMLPNKNDLTDKSEKLQAIGEVMEKLNEFLLQKLTPLLIRGAGGIDNAIIAELGANKVLFTAYFLAVAEILNYGLMKMIENLPGAKEVAIAEAKIPHSINLLRITQPLFVALSDFMKSTKDESLTTIANNRDDYVAFYKDLCSVIWNGVYIAISKYLPDSSHLGYAAERIQASIELLDMSVALYRTLNDFEDKTSSGDLKWIASNHEKLKEYYWNLCSVIWWSVREPIRAFLPTSTDASQAKDQIDASIKMMQSLSTMYQSLSGFITSSNSTELSALAQNPDQYKDKVVQLSAFVWNGIVIPVAKYLPTNTDQEVQKIDASIKLMKSFLVLTTNLQSMASQIASTNITGIDLDSIIKKIGTFNLNDLKNINPINSTEIDKLQVVIDSYDKFLNLLNTLEKTMLGIARKLESISQIQINKTLVPPAAPKTPEPVMPPAAPKTPEPVMPPVKPVTNNVADEIIKGWNAQIGNFDATIFKTGEILYKSEDGNTYKADKNFLGQRMYQKVDAQTAPMASPVSANMNDIESKLMAQKAGTSIPVNEIKSKELSTIADENAEQNEKLATLIDLFQKVVAFMTPTSQPNVGSSNFDKANTMPNTRDLPPPRYARSTSGLPDTMPGKAVVNKGQVST